MKTLGAVLLQEVASPTNPASGYIALFAKADGRPYFKDDAGVESPVSPLIVKALAADATANSTVTAAKITGLDCAAPIGTYQFQYFIRYQSSIVTTGVKLSVNYTGTVTAFVYNMRYVDVAATASTGAPSQNANASTGQVMGSYSARAKSAAAGVGPTLSVDAANSDMLIVIEGTAIVTVAGNFELYHASETAAATTVKAGSSLLLAKVA